MESSFKQMLLRMQIIQQLNKILFLKCKLTVIIHNRHKIIAIKYRSLIKPENIFSLIILINLYF